jgi:hypothetical protein
MDVLEDVYRAYQIESIVGLGQKRKSISTMDVQNSEAAPNFHVSFAQIYAARVFVTFVLHEIQKFPTATAEIKNS